MNNIKFSCYTIKNYWARLNAVFNSANFYCIYKFYVSICAIEKLQLAAVFNWQLIA